MRAIMYHYVRVHKPELPNYRYLDFSNFRRQLDYFSETYGFVSSDEWDQYIVGRGCPSSKGKIVLTFDDALSCHYDYVFAELRNRGLWGIFYIPVQPYIDGKLLDVHRIHLLCGAFDSAILLKIAKGLVSEDMISLERREEFEQEPYNKQINHEGTTEFKRLLNYFVDYHYRSDIIDQIEKEKKFSSSSLGFYVGEAQIKEMADHGMKIGSHTKSHPVMSRLSYTDQKREIEASFYFLESLCDLKQRTYCHPYGGFHSFNSDTVALLNSFRVDYSFSVESRNIETDDIVYSKQHLPRFDCSEFAFGRAS